MSSSTFVTDTPALSKADAVPPVETIVYLKYQKIAPSEVPQLKTAKTVWPNKGTLNNFSLFLHAKL